MSSAGSAAVHEKLVRALLPEPVSAGTAASLDRPGAWADFDATHVDLRGVSALVALGDAGFALQAARPLTRRRVPVPERRAALWVETARAYSQQGRLADGHRALRIAETCAAQDVRRPSVRALVADMAAHGHRRGLPELHQSSRRLGVPA